MSPAYELDGKKMMIHSKKADGVKQVNINLIKLQQQRQDIINSERQVEKSDPEVSELLNRKSVPKTATRKTIDKSINDNISDVASNSSIKKSGRGSIGGNGRLSQLFQNINKKIEQKLELKESNRGSVDPFSHKESLKTHSDIDTPFHNLNTVQRQSSLAVPPKDDEKSDSFDIDFSSQGDDVCDNDEIIEEHKVSKSQRMNLNQ